MARTKNRPSDDQARPWIDRGFYDDRQLDARQHGCGDVDPARVYSIVGEFPGRVYDTVTDLGCSTGVQAQVLNQSESTVHFGNN